MKIKNSENESIYLLQIAGDVAGEDVRKLQKKLQVVIQGQSKKLIIEMSEVDFIDSHGLGVLIFTWKEMESQKREFALKNPSHFVKEILISTNLEKVLPLC